MYTFLLRGLINLVRGSNVSRKTKDSYHSEILKCGLKQW